MTSSASSIAIKAPLPEIQLSLNDITIISVRLGNLCSILKSIPDEIWEAYIQSKTVVHNHITWKLDKIRAKLDVTDSSKKTIKMSYIKGKIGLLNYDLDSETGRYNRHCQSITPRHTVFQDILMLAGRPSIKIYHGPHGRGRFAGHHRGRGGYASYDDRGTTIECWLIPGEERTPRSIDLERVGHEYYREVTLDDEAPSKPYVLLKDYMEGGYRKYGNVYITFHRTRRNTWALNSDIFEDIVMTAIFKSGTEIIKMLGKHKLYFKLLMTDLFSGRTSIPEIPIVHISFNDFLAYRSFKKANRMSTVSVGAKACARRSDPDSDSKVDEDGHHFMAASTGSASTGSASAGSASAGSASARRSDPDSDSKFPEEDGHRFMGGGASATALTGLRLTDNVPTNESAVRSAMQLFRTNPELMEKLSLAEPRIEGSEFRAMGMDICSFKLPFRVCPPECPIKNAFVRVWLKDTEGNAVVEGGFSPNHYETWAQLLDATINAVHQVETHTDYPFAAAATSAVASAVASDATASATVSNVASARVSLHDPELELRRRFVAERRADEETAASGYAALLDYELRRHRLRVLAGVVDDEEGALDEIAFRQHELRRMYVAKLRLTKYGASASTSAVSASAESASASAEFGGAEESAIGDVSAIPMMSFTSDESGSACGGAGGKSIKISRGKGISPIIPKERVYIDPDIKRLLLGRCFQIATEQPTKYSIFRCENAACKKHNVDRIIFLQRICVDGKCNSRESIRHFHKYKCTECSTEACGLCSKPASDHMGETQVCHKKITVTSAMRLAARAEGNNYCPTCETAISRTRADGSLDGCPHLKCPLCSTHFCALCDGLLGVHPETGSRYTHECAGAAAGADAHYYDHAAIARHRQNVANGWQVGAVMDVEVNPALHHRM
jgi:hypothetical protein